jgi:hypothetical protein
MSFNVNKDSNLDPDGSFEAARSETPVTSKNYSFEQGEITVEPLPDSMKVAGDMNAAIIPPGRYFVGDPCYSAGYDDKAWQDWCVLVDSDPEVRHGDKELLGGLYSGFPVIGVHTEYGDGEYNDQEENKYPVDAGLIGVVPEELIIKMGVPYSKFEGLGHWETFTGSTVVARGEKGLIHIGHLTIDTDPEYEGEEDDEVESWGDDSGYYDEESDTESLEQDGNDR